MTFKSSGASEARLPPAQAGPRPTAPAWGRSRGSLVSPNLGGDGQLHEMRRHVVSLSARAPQRPQQFQQVPGPVLKRGREI